MNSPRLTNGLLLVIAVALWGHLLTLWCGRTAEAETFRLDSCITDRPNDTPVSYLHVVMHGMADTETP